MTLAERCSLALRKRVNLTYCLRNKEGARGTPQSLGIKLLDCQCDEAPNPACRNVRQWVIDWRADKPVTRRLCPRSVQDLDLWECVYTALYEVKDLINSKAFWGIPVAHLGEPVYQVLEQAYQARARYQAQRDYMER